VREIHDARHAEDDRQPRCDEKQRRCVRQSGEELDEVGRHFSGDGARNDDVRGDK